MDEARYNTWDTSEELKQNLVDLGKAYENTVSVITQQPISRVRQRASATTLYSDVLPNISVTDEFSRQDYDYFRPSETVPQNIKGIFCECARACEDIGIVASIVDLMVDFAIQGVKPIQFNRKAQRETEAWWKRVDGYETSERICNYLLRLGNVVTTRETGTIDDRSNIPLKYWIFDPIETEPIACDLARYSRNRIFGLRLTSGMLKIMNKAKRTPEEQFIYDGIPSFIKNAKPKTIKSLVLLPQDKTRSLHYKRNQKHVWAMPLMRPFLYDFIVLRKAKLADLKALDGAVFKIRHWKIGSLEYKMIPNDSMLNSFQNLLMNAVNSGASLDIVTGPEVSFEESKSDIAAFLGEEKYIPTLRAIYAGFGIPSSLVGSNEAGMVNNQTSLKVFIKRIEYLRKLLMNFWDEEFRIFQEAIGHRRRAKLTFDYESLQDESAQKALLIQLVDRRIVSAESVLDAFGFIPEIEEMRLNRQNAKEETNRPISAFEAAQPEYGLKKIFAQRGDVTPSEVGLELDPRKPGEISGTDVQIKQIQNKPKISKKNKQGVPGEGRPKNSNDTEKRKQRMPKASFDSKAELYEYIKDQYLIHKSISSEQLSTFDFSVINNLTDYVYSANKPFGEALDAYISSRD